MKCCNGFALLFLAATLGLFSGQLRAQDKPAEGLPLDPMVEKILDTAKPPSEPGAILPGALAIDQPLWVQATGASRAVKLTVHSLALRKQFGQVSPSTGRQLLVLDTEWENIIPLSFVHDRNVPTEYRVNPVSDHLYVVVNGVTNCRLVPKSETIPGHLPTRDFKLERIGSILRGNAIFEIPQGPISSLELRFYDYAHGHAMLKLWQSSTASPEPRLLSPLVQNEVLSAGAYGITEAGELNGTTAPAGMKLITVDFRANSTIFLQGDATAFDPKAKPGDKLPIGTVADWTDAMQYAWLVADGEYACAARPELSTLGLAPRFLPDLKTGGAITFLAPADAKSLELRCDFPNAKSSDGKLLRPKGFSIPLQGTRPESPQRDAIVSIDDKPFTVNVEKSEAVDEFSGKKPATGSRFLVLDMNVANAGPNGEMFQTRQQLKFVASNGRQSSMDESTFAGVHQPADLLWIPPGEHRRFQVVFLIASSEAKPRLGYAGVTTAKVFDLPAITPVAAPNPGNVSQVPAEKPAEKPAEIAKANDAPAVDPMPVETPAPVQISALKKAATILVDGREFPARIPARQPSRQARGLAGVGLTPEQVNKAIDRGAEALWKITKQELVKEKRKFGEKQEDGLVALALVHADYHRKNAEFDAALRAMISNFDQRERFGTYEMGLNCMTIEAYDDPSYSPQLRLFSQWFIDIQGTAGTWGYGNTIIPKIQDQETDSTAPRALRVLGSHAPDEPPAGGEPLVRRTKWRTELDGDNSVTQYALLGIHSSARLGVKFPKETFEKLLKETLARQCQDGSWAYHSTSGSGYGSMTCAGICAVALSRFHLGQEPYAEHESIERGLAWLNAHFTVKDNPEYQDRWVYYYLYSLERVGRILDTEFVGEHEWYPLGARFLVDNQKADGLWFHKNEENEEHKELPSSFSLLFLTRATQTLKNVAKTGPGTLRTNVIVPPGNRVYLILDCSGSMLDEINGQQKFEVTRAAVTDLIKAMPDDSELAMRAYGYRKRAIEEGADEDTNLLVPMDKLDRKKMDFIMQGIRARGKTPLALSLDEAAKDLSRFAGDKEKVTVVLLTDGGEDTLPRRDPVKAAAEFGKVKNIDLRIVGFDINRQDWEQQLQKMTVAAHGQYLRASQAAQLTRELQAAVFGIPESFSLSDKDGKLIAAGAPFGKLLTLPAGKYSFSTVFGGRTFGESLWISPGQTTSITFNAAAIAHDLRSVVPNAPNSNATPPPVAPAEPVKEPAQPGAKKFCSNCGKPVTPGAKFCNNCGNKLE